MPPSTPADTTEPTSDLERRLEEAVDQRDKLAGEMQHRIKNVLAMVASIANQTLRGDDLASAAKAFSGRLMTLSRTHDILAQTGWGHVPIRHVVEGSLAAYRTGHNEIYVDGPDVAVQPKQALALAMAMHELATNAVKFGALSGDGRIDVSWSRGDGAAPGFRFRWAESGGPPVSEPAPEAKGFGSRVIESVLAGDFYGEVTMRYEASGLVCELVAPLRALEA